MPLMSCHVGMGGHVVPSHYAQSFDSASSSCRTNPALCVQVAGEETVIPRAGQRLAEFGTAVGTIRAALGPEQEARINQVLSECANEARLKVLLEHMDGKSPTPVECDEKKKFGGKVRTRAQFFGEEMHRAAFQCVQEKLSVLRPGGFSLEPRYRYDQRTRQRELISAEEEQALLEEGCFNELKGTIKPDVVIHSGDPLQPQAVYDYKFPCKNTDKAFWCQYAQGPYAGLWQNAVYKEILGIQPHQVLPWIGVVP
ncbi:hypothetical protein [Cystobacter fuscus]|uniref:hypothetical protein n=1 Tax=Cystobacter fuscus TaxID=43 RepID=UPI002B314E45|nr:hypothetical protein F0U63_27575 [Cystobacter fuscus]